MFDLIASLAFDWFAAWRACSAAMALLTLSLSNSATRLAASCWGRASCAALWGSRAAIRFVAERDFDG